MIYAGTVGGPEKDGDRNDSLDFAAQMGHF
jgi:hypothetical protein